MNPEARMVFLGVMLVRDMIAAPKHRADAACAKIGSNMRHLTTKAIPAKVCVSRFRAEIVPVWLLGRFSWHIRNQNRLAPFAPRTKLGWTGRCGHGAWPGKPSRRLGLAIPPQLLWRARWPVCIVAPLVPPAVESALSLKVAFLVRRPGPHDPIWGGAVGRLGPRPRHKKGRPKFWRTNLVG